MYDEPENYGEDDRLDAAFAAYLRSCDTGDHDQRDAFLAQFPELEPELRKLIATADLLQRFVSAPDDSAPEVSAGRGSGRPRVSSTAETVSAAFTGDYSTPDSSTDLPGAADATRAIPPAGLASDPRGVVTRGRGAASAAHAAALARDPNPTLPAEDRPDDHPGPRLPFELGDYQLRRVIGRGGMGVVYLATQLGLDRQVAVKMIRSGILAGEDEVRRFRTEARAAAHLKHPHIVTVHHFGYLEGHHYFSMDYVPGTDLARMVAAGPLPIQDSARYVRDCARAIHYAHQHGILHRDLKPANVLIDESDQVRVTDFGLAKHTDTDSSLTASGTAVGTPNYMAPEQASGHGERAAQAADIYSLGAILFALLTGRPPFQADSVVQTLMQVVHRPVPSPREFRPEIPVDLETIVCKCLEKDPKKRYHSAEALSEDLERFLQGRPVHAKARGHLLRLWHWLCDVPVVAALTGRRVLDTSESHRRFQAAMLVLALVLPLVALSAFWWQRWRGDQMPDYVRIAGGLEGGLYDDISGEIAHRISRSVGVDATVVSTQGSLENRQQLLSGRVHLAPMQSSAIRGEQLCVVAPLFYEVVHVLARPGAGIESVADLRNRKVAVGPEGSGSRVAANLLFDSYGLTDHIDYAVMPWQELSEHDDIDAAVLCIGVGSNLVTGMLRGNQFVLLPIPDAMQISLEHPTLRPLHISASAYPGIDISAGGIPSVGLTAFLAARTDAPSVLVEATLRAIYDPPPLYREMIPLRGAAEFQGMKLHPAAREFFDREIVD